MNGRDFKRVFDLIDEHGFFETFSDESFFSGLKDKELLDLLESYWSSITEMDEYIDEGQAPALKKRRDDSDDLDHLDDPARWRRYIREMVDQEGFDYLFKHYDTFDRIKDKEFHEKRRAFLKANNELADFMGLDEEIVGVDSPEENEAFVAEEGNDEFLDYTNDGLKRRGIIDDDEDEEL